MERIKVSPGKQKMVVKTARQPARFSSLKMVAPSAAKVVEKK
jgi:hypothetical protein